jgi:hypothetical protein
VAFEIETRGLANFTDFLRRAEETANRAAVMATNDAALLARRLSSTEIRKEVNFTAGYLSGSGDKARLSISKKATASDLEAIITGRDRPTSLARFSTGAPSFNTRRAPRVRVSGGGSTKVLQGAFFMRLRKGSQEVRQENANIGLAVRLKRGETVRNKTTSVPIGDGLYLLYGPSVGQVFAAVAADIEPRVSDALGTEFVRQFERLTDA